MATEAQEAVFKQVAAAANHFETLGIADFEKCNVEDIKKVYRKLTLVVHPDKCSDERAADAFGKIDKAYKILSDPATLQRFREAAQRKRMRDIEQGNTGEPKVRKVDADMTPAEREAMARKKSQDDLYSKSLRLQKQREDKARHDAQEAEKNKNLNEQLTSSHNNWKNHLRNMNGSKI